MKSSKRYPVLFVALVATVAALSCQSVPSSPSEASLEPTVADALAQIEAAGPPVSPLPDIRPRPRPPSTFVPASPDTRSQKDIDAAACWGFEDGKKAWRCRGKPPVTFMAAASSPIIPSSWTVAAWFVNKLTGSDSNACTSSGSPCATKQEIWVHRWGMNGSGGGNCPRFRQITTLEQDASDTDNTDPLYPCAALEAGASLIIKGGPPTTTSATFTRVAQKNRTAGANSLLQGSFSAGTPAAGVLLTNLTHPSKAFIYQSVGGGTWSITQPLVANVPVTGLTGVEVDTWATNDTVTLATPISVNIVSAAATIADDNAAFTNALYLYNLTIFDPAAQADTVAFGNNVFIQEVVSQRFISYYDSVQTSLNQRFAANLFSAASMQESGGASLDPIFLGGALLGSNVFIGDPDFSSDVIIGGGGGFVNLILAGDTHDSSIGGVGTNGSVYLDGPLNVLNSRLQIASTGAVIYGSASGQISLFGTAHVTNSTSATFVQRFTAPSLIAPGIVINGNSTACSATAAGAINCGISTTPAHLDAAAGAAGFGGSAFVFGGASVANF